MRASNGEAQRGGASLLLSLLSSTTSPPVASPVVPAGEPMNIVFLSLILFLLLFQYIACAAFPAFPAFFKVK